MSKKICCVSGCDKEVHGLGYCNSHYRHYKRYGHPTDKPNKPTVCTVDDCNESVYCKGMCKKHYNKYRYQSNKNKEPKEKIEYDECIVNGCTNKPCSKYSCYCGKHYNQIREHGHILQRTIYDSNEIIMDEVNDCAYVVLYNKECEEVARTKVDINIIDEVKDFKWRLDNDKRVNNDKVGFMHRYIYTLVYGDIPDNMIIDHKDRDPLNNTIDNLRLATHSQNAQNRSIGNNNKTGVLNVFIEEDKYIVKVNGTKYGRYDTLEEAKEVARKVSIELYGEFSPYYDDNDKDKAAPNSLFEIE